jgi:hypothetical protein
MWVKMVLTKHRRAMEGRSSLGSSSEVNRKPDGSACCCSLQFEHTMEEIQFSWSKFLTNNKTVK